MTRIVFAIAVLTAAIYAADAAETGGATLTGLPKPSSSEGLPSLRGIDSAGHSVAAPGGLKDPKQAKLLWKSEEPGLGVGWGITSRPSNKGRDMTWSSGYGGPVVANGQVYLVYYRPEGRSLMRRRWPRPRTSGRRAGR